MGCLNSEREGSLKLVESGLSLTGRDERKGKSGCGMERVVCDSGLVMGDW